MEHLHILSVNKFSTGESNFLLAKVIALAMYPQPKANQNQNQKIAYLQTGFSTF